MWNPWVSVQIFPKKALWLSVLGPFTEAVWNVPRLSQHALVEGEVGRASARVEIGLAGARNQGEAKHFRGVWVEIHWFTAENQGFFGRNRDKFPKIPTSSRKKVFLLWF